MRCHSWQRRSRLSQSCLMAAKLNTIVSISSSKPSTEIEQQCVEIEVPSHLRRLDHSPNMLSDCNKDPSMELGDDSSVEEHRSSLAEQQVTVESNGNNKIDHFSRAIAHSEAVVCQVHWPLKQITDCQKPSDSRPTSSRSAHAQQQRMDAVAPTFSSRTPMRPNNDVRVSKRRREKGKNLPVRQQSITSNGKLAAYALTEERLFELLIGKIRQREENEIAAADFQLHLKGQNAQLAVENQELRGQLEKYREQLQKMAADSKVRQSRIDSWKAKLQKFKDTVNGLGNEYDILRHEADTMKDTTTSLEKEKNDLVEAIDGTKVQIARAEAKIDEQKEKISAKDREISTLRQALETVKEKLKDAGAELAEEKKRGANLESYILNYARVQARQLISIREDQSELLEKFTSTLAIISEESVAPKDTILSEMRSLTDDLQSSVQKLGEKCSAERLNVQEFSNAAHDIVSG